MAEVPCAIVFDLWFTLISPDDFRPPTFRTIDAIPAVLQLEPGPFKKYWLQRLPEMHATPRDVSEYIADYCRSLDRALTEQDHTEFDAIWSAHDKALASPRPGVVDALSRLQSEGYRLGLLSNAHEREVRAWTSSPLAACFSAACFSYDIRVTKPAAESYRCVLRLLDVSPQEAVFVGDGGSGELEGARRVGFGKVVRMRGLPGEPSMDEEAIRLLSGQADDTIDRIDQLRASLASD